MPEDAVEAIADDFADDLDASAAVVATVPRPPRPAVAPLAIGLALTALAGFGGAVVGGVGGALLAGLAALGAQPAFALALRGGRVPPREALPVAALWALALLATCVLLAWPLSALRQGGTLGAALATSAVAGLVLIGLWRTWPLWRWQEGEGGDLRAHGRALVDTDTRDWRGLGAAALLALPLLGAVLLAWPDLMSPALRWAVAGACALAWPLAHRALLRLPSPSPVRDEDLLQAALDEDDAEAAGIDALGAAGEGLDAALYDAARHGRVERTLALLDAGANPHAPPPAKARDQRSLAMLAAVLPDLRLLRTLIAHGVDLNDVHANMTPLIAATRDSWHGRPEAVMTLLANGADPRVPDADGNTPLHHAARSADPGVAALLRDAGAEIDPPNREGLTPLALACTAGNWRLARFLLERGAKPDLPGAVPALLAAAGGDEDDPVGVQLLLRHKARADARDARGRSALHEAAYAGHAEIVGVVLGAGADVHARDHAQRTPFLEAARGGHLAALQALQVGRPDVHATDANGRHALILACRADAPTPALIRALLDLGLDREHADDDGRRAVDYAAAAGRWALVAAIDSDYGLPASVGGADEPDAPPPDRPPLDLLREALDAGDGEAASRWATLVDPVDLAGLLREGTLHNGAAPASPARIDWLLRHGANPDARDAAGDTPLFAWLAQGPSAAPAVQTLLRRGVSPAGAGGLARFLAGCVAADRADRGLERLALDLVERGADPFAASPAGDPPLALAVRLGWGALIDRLIAMGVALDARDAHGMTALHLAAALRREGTLKQLIVHGASPNVRAADGQTPLGVALSSGRRDLADWLDWRHWPLPGRPLRATDLPAAAVLGDADAVRRLLDLGLPIDAVDAQGCTALLRAAGGGHRGVVELLLARGADPALAARTGATPLSAAVSMRQLDIVDRLLAAGATLEQRLPGDVTVLMLAAALGLPDVCTRLLAAGANIAATDAQGLTPLHCAGLYGFTTRDRRRLVALFDALLLAGADPDAQAAGGVTPLLLLLGARAEPGTACDEDVVVAGLVRLLDEGATLRVRDPRGFGPLHLAALHGLLRVTRELLQAGAEPEARDALNRTPREVAVMRGFVDVAAEFGPRTGDVSMARFLRDRES
ncbi:MAG: ankyrin repeat domain-containing protein [Xanthomonadales bacterium]|nr:ankyrin repeat domain-containing protein [Xanthomonadales bacterium]